MDTSAGSYDDGPTQRAGIARTVLVVGPLPPPMHGAAMATYDIAEALTTHSRVRRYDISPSKENRTGVANLVKPIRIGLAVFGVIRSAHRRSKTLFLALDGGLGLAYDVAIAAVARLCRYRIFMQHHSFAYINQPSRLMRLLTRIAGRRATHVVLCRFMAEGLQRRYPGALCIRILSGAALVAPADPPPERRRTGELRVGMLSNLLVEKGLDTAIDLLRELLRQGIPARLVLAGRAPNDAARKLIASAQAEFGAAFDWLGPLPEDAKRGYFEELDVFVFPTRYANEAQPRVIFEAIAHGVPVITVARSCMPEDMGSDAGICIDPNADFVKVALPRLAVWAADPFELERASTRAFQHSRSLHLAATGQLEALVEDVVGRTAE